MTTLLRIRNTEDPALTELMPIYAEAFPLSERRSEKQLKRLIKENDSMYFNLVLFEGKIAGLFVYWNLADFFFLEHLAISPDMRNHKIGQQVLDWIADNLNGIRLMEVEPSGSSEFASRRIAYYERNGYKILNKNYQQPSYSNKNISYPMRIMGNQEVAELNSYIDKIIIKVYTKYYA